MKLPDKSKGIVALIGLACLYATIGIFTRYLNTSFPFFQQLYLRLFAGSLIGFIIFRKQIDWKKLKRISLKEWWLLIVRAATYYLLGVVIFNKAVLSTKLSTVSFISSIPMTAILGFLVLREKATSKKILYLALAFVGVVVISIKDFSSVFAWGFGEILAFVSVIFTSYSIVIRRWHGKLLNNRELTQIILTLAAILVMMASFASGEGLPVNGWDLKNLIVIFVAGLTNVLIILLTNYGFQKVKTSIASNLLTLEMLFAVLFGFFLYREIPTIKDAFGALLILVSVIQMNKLE